MIDYREIARPPRDYADEPMRVPDAPRFRIMAGQHWIGACLVGCVFFWIVLFLLIRWL